MVSFSTKAEAVKFATKRRRGFRRLLLTAKEPSKSMLISRKKFLREAIKSVKIRRIKRRGWHKAIYDVEGY